MSRNRHAFCASWCYFITSSPVKYSCSFLPLILLNNWTIGQNTGQEMAVVIWVFLRILSFWLFSCIPWTVKMSESNFLGISDLIDYSSVFFVWNSPLGNAFHMPSSPQKSFVLCFDTIFSTLRITTAIRSTTT